MAPWSEYAVTFSVIIAGLALAANAVPEDSEARLTNRARQPTTTYHACQMILRLNILCKCFKNGSSLICLSLPTPFALTCLDWQGSLCHDRDIWNHKQNESNWVPGYDDKETVIRVMLMTSQLFWAQRLPMR